MEIFILVEMNKSITAINMFFLQNSSNIPLYILYFHLLYNIVLLFLSPLQMTKVEYHFSLQYLVIFVKAVLGVGIHTHFLYLTTHTLCKQVNNHKLTILFNCQNPNPTSTQPNLTQVWVLRQNDFAHPPPTTIENSMSAIAHLLMARF